MDILTLGLGRLLGLELGRQDVPGLKSTGVSFLASGWSRQDVADPYFVSDLKFQDLLPIQFLGLVKMMSSCHFKAILLANLCLKLLPTVFQPL